MDPSLPFQNMAWDWAHVHRVALAETRSILGSGADAEDAAQEAALRAWRAQSKCRASDRPDPWLREIARNEALRLAGRRRPDAPLEIAGDPGAPGHDPDAGAAHGDLRRAMGALDHTDRTLLFLRYWGDLTQPEVARVTRIPEGTVKVRLHRARGRLRTTLSSA
jgi:RNA polymerase sigma-70 factor (ECF subfamily)